MNGIADEIFEYMLFMRPLNPLENAWKYPFLVAGVAVVTVAEASVVTVAGGPVGGFAGGTGAAVDEGVQSL